MKLKRFLFTFLASTMIFSMMSITVNAQNILMEDAKNSWAAKSIECWVSEGVVSGDDKGNFNSESVYKFPFFLAYLFTWQEDGGLEI